MAEMITSRQNRKIIDAHALADKKTRDKTGLFAVEGIKLLNELVSENVKLCEIYPSPGYTDEIIHCYLVRNATFVGEKCDEGEFLSCNFYSIDYVLKMIDTGEITDAKTVVSIYKYLLELRKD